MMGQTDRKNVIIVGAGASKEFNLPTGEELKSIIESFATLKFNDFGRPQNQHSDYVFGLLKKLTAGENLNEYLEGADQIRKNMSAAPSIDNFLDTRQEDLSLVEFGKLAITVSLLKAERRSTLFVDPNKFPVQIDLASNANTWIGRLFSILVAQRNFSDFLAALKNITFISFNYDRCIHQFICYAAQSYFNLSAVDVEEVINSLNILYPYGSVGDFTWCERRGTPFGVLPDTDRILQISKELRTFTQGSEDETVERMRNALNEADLVMFLGFGFHQLNLDLLRNSEPFRVDRVLATGKGISENSRLEILGALGHIFYKGLGNVTRNLGDRELQIVDMYCTDFFHEFHYLLSNR